VPSIPPVLDQLVLRLLAKDPAARGRDAGDVARELDRIAGSAPRRRRSPLALGAVAALLLAGAASAAYVVLGRKSAPPPGVAAPPPPPAAPPGVPRRPERAFPPQCRSFLATKRTKLTGFAGDYAWRHAQAVEALAWTPDGRFLLSTAGWTERTLRAWRASTAPKPGRAARTRSHRRSPSRRTGSSPSRAVTTARCSSGTWRPARGSPISPGSASPCGASPSCRAGAASSTGAATVSSAVPTRAPSGRSGPPRRELRSRGSSRRRTDSSSRRRSGAVSS